MISQNFLQNSERLKILYYEIKDFNLNYITYILFLCLLLKLRSIKLYTIPFAIILLIGNISEKYSGSDYVYIMLFLIVAAIDIKMEYIVYYNIIVKSFILFLTIFLSLNGIIENKIELGRNREYLGFDWTTTPFMHYCYILFMFLSIKKKKINLKEYIIFNIINIWFFIRTNTKMAFLITFLVLLFFFVFGNDLKKITEQKFIKKIVFIMPWICFIFIYIISVKYNEDNSIYYELNKFLSNRLVFCKRAFTEYGFTLFGQPINFITSGYNANYVDAAYLQYSLKYGLIPFAVLMVLLEYLIYRCYKNKKYNIIWIIFFICIFALSEQQLFRWYYNGLFLLCFAEFNKYDYKTSVYNRVDGKVV